MAGFDPFTKEIVPWWDASWLCVLLFVLMMAVLAFGLLGVHVGWARPENRGDVWVPGLLIVFSGAAILSLVVRLVRRHARPRNSRL